MWPHAQQVTYLGLAYIVMCVHPLQPCVWLCSSVLHCTVLYGVRLP